ncbi:ROK family transcriptional regulator [Clostridiaceae bacterium UIB06]|uniref:ROK family transcriptional regulator n=1 Tax=Clostridium thailandense TaxID=2794346 RepID=A0A949TZL0_9CLOT|nr:ROK family transcriptional regulator [Clostridium thailandense]MBV7274711.1 ROK family transcriptional regulator [Clostridium thailandense]MCH5137378.1 ROK family transcriptional regulator [Clostridiaceae bacterium UIB06]
MNKLKAIDQETIKVLNQKKMLQLLYRNKKLTKQDISQALNVSIPTVISNVKELIEQGFLEESGVAESTGGRKPTIIRFLPDSRYSFGVCITRGKVRIIIVNLYFDIIAERAINIPEELNDFESLILDIKKEMDSILSDFNIPKDKVLGLGFALPGTVNEKKMLLENAPNFKLKNICFKDYKNTFEYPLYIENEANTSASAEAFINFNNTSNSLVFVSITEGIGTGIIIGESLYKGYNKRAGELGHMTIVKDGKQCNCGKKGCWELYASQKSLINEYREVFNIENKSLSYFLNLAIDDIKAKEILDRYLDYLAEGIKNIILMLDPRNIIIGGEISNYKNLIDLELKKKIFKENSLYNDDDRKVLFSNLDGNAAVFGAALMPMEKLFFISDKVI